MARLTIRPAALHDLIEIRDYIALDDPVRDRSYVAEIEALIVEKTGMVRVPYGALDMQRLLGQ